MVVAVQPSLPMYWERNRFLDHTLGIEVLKWIAKSCAWEIMYRIFDWRGLKVVSDGEKTGGEWVIEGLSKALKTYQNPVYQCR